ncbi:MAG: hypothetical protein JKY65_02330 [Planctomycetes bacterium]|nr:hypothetical protein [Planctomycetota bacterium]
MSPGSRGDILTRYSPFAVDRGVSAETLLQIVLEGLHSCESHEARTPSGSCRIHFAQKAWESTYFQRPTVQLLAPLFECEFADLAAPLRSLLERLSGEGTETLFAEVPAEDSLWLQALSGHAGFRLIETRLHYRHDQLAPFLGPRYGSRLATEDDIPNLRRVAIEMRNPYDRFHADVRYPDEVADDYLATYVENCVRGFADLVVVPDQPGLPADSFMAGRLHRDLTERLGKMFGKILLSAVSRATNRGWHEKLVSELTHALAEQGAETVYVNTQATSGAVVHTWEKLGYKLGRVTHILARDLSRDGVQV